MRTLLQEWVGLSFLPDGRGRPVAGINDGRIAKRKQHGPNGVHQRRVVASRQVGATNRTGEQCVTDEEVHFSCASCPSCPSRSCPRLLIHREAHAARTMPRRVMWSRHEIAESNDFVGRIEVIDGRRLVDLQPKQSAVLDGLVVQEEIVAMKMDGNVERPFRGADTGDVVDMRMRQQNARQRDAFTRGECEQTLDLIAWIDQHAFPCPWTRDDETVFEEWADRLRLDYDHEVILAILDDLLFTSKIRDHREADRRHLVGGQDRATARSREMRANLPRW